MGIVNSNMKQSDSPQFKIEGELNPSREANSPWNWVGYGELISKNDSPLTIFLGIENSRPANRNGVLTFETDFFSIDVHSYLFQKYRIRIGETNFLFFQGNTDFKMPAKHIGLKSINISKKVNKDLTSLLQDAWLLIEQDQFFGLDEFY